VRVTPPPHWYIFILDYSHLYGGLYGKRLLEITIKKTFDTGSNCTCSIDSLKP